jgi:segregation and condensation protein B
VDVGAVVRSLVERKLVRIAGHRDVPGRPLLYATSKRFLEVFGFSRLEDLPTLREIDDLVPSETGGDAEADEAEGTPNSDGGDAAPLETSLHGAADAAAEIGSGSGELH